VNSYPKHEQKLKELALGLGFTHVSLSSEVMPMIRAVPRGFTTCADSYLTPLIKDYLTVGFHLNIYHRRAVDQKSTTEELLYFNRGFHQDLKI